MRRLQSEGITILMVTHDVEFAASVSNRCAMFFDRELTSVDPPEEFFCDNKMCIRDSGLLCITARISAEQVL